MDAVELIDQPAVEEKLVELGCGDLASLGAGLDELIFRKVGDEAQEPRVGGEPQEVSDSINQVQPGLGLRLVSREEVD